MSRWLVAVAVLVLAACDGGAACNYDNGYDDGYDGALPECEATDYMEGFQAGEFESDCDWYRCEKPNYDNFKQMSCGSWESYRCP